MHFLFTSSKEVIYGHGPTIYRVCPCVCMHILLVNTLCGGLSPDYARLTPETAAGRSQGPEDSQQPGSLFLRLRRTEFTESPLESWLR